MLRLIRKRPMLSESAQRQIVDCIQAAESKTSGEIRVFIEHHCSYVDPLLRAREIFGKLGMEKTVARNAIVVYVALSDRQFALYGDEMIHSKAGGAAFWTAAALRLTGHLKQNEVVQGICNCITELGMALETHFPHDPTVKKNELPDEIVFGK